MVAMTLRCTRHTLHAPCSGAIPKLSFFSQNYYTPLRELQDAGDSSYRRGKQKATSPLEDALAKKARDVTPQPTPDPPSRPPSQPPSPPPSPNHLNSAVQDHVAMHTDMEGMQESLDQPRNTAGATSHDSQQVVSGSDPATDSGIQPGQSNDASGSDVNSTVGYLEHLFLYPNDAQLPPRNSKDSNVNSQGRKFIGLCRESGLRVNIYIFIAIALDESIFLDVLHFPMKNIKSRDVEATPMGGGDVKTSQ